MRAVRVRRVLHEVSRVGDIVEEYVVRSSPGEKSRTLRLYFDSGSPHTFVKEVAVEGFPRIQFPVRKTFRGLGGGRFFSLAAVTIEIRFLEYWCGHYAYVIDDDLLSEEMDVLVGHDLMQKFKIQLDPKGRRTRLDEPTLKRANLVW